VQGVGETIGATPPEFQVLVGSAASVYPSLAIGARGAILALACALPEKCVALFNLFQQGHHEQARQLQFVLARASKLIVSELGIAGVKHAMDQRGYRGGIPRLPLQPLHDEQKETPYRPPGCLGARCREGVISNNRVELMRRFLASII